MNISTRTRTSFELAGKYLGADVVNITTSSSSVVKGECLRDTILTVQSMACDAIVMRHPIEGAAAYAAKVADPVIINAGDGAHAHPSQGFLDMFTIREQGKNLKGLKMAIIGDILNFAFLAFAGGAGALFPPTFSAGGTRRRFCRQR